MKFNTRRATLLLIPAGLSLLFWLYRTNWNIPPLPTPSFPIYTITFRWLSKFLLDLSDSRWIPLMSDLIGIGSFVLSIMLFMVDANIIIRTRQPENPFELIHSTSDLEKALWLTPITRGSNQIPYCERSDEEKIHEGVFEKMRITPYVVLYGENGSGKTREVFEIAKKFIEVGYAVLNLNPQGEPILSRSEYWPEKWPRKDLVIILEDIHLLWRQEVRIQSSEGEPSIARLIPSQAKSFEERLLEFIKWIKKFVPDFKLIISVNSLSPFWIDQSILLSSAFQELNPEKIEIPNLTPPEVLNFIDVLLDYYNHPIKLDLSELAIQERNGSFLNVIFNLNRFIQDDAHRKKEYIPTIFGSLEQILESSFQNEPLTNDLLKVLVAFSYLRIPPNRNLVLQVTKQFARKSIDRIQGATSFLIKKQICVQKSEDLLLPDDVASIIKISQPEIQEIISHLFILIPFHFSHTKTDFYMLDTLHTLLFEMRGLRFYNLVFFLIWQTRAGLHLKLGIQQSNEKAKIGITKKFLAFIITRLIFLPIAFAMMILQILEYGIWGETDYLVELEAKRGERFFKEVLSGNSKINFRPQVLSIMRARFANVIAKDLINKGEFKAAEEIIKENISEDIPKTALTRSYQILGFALGFQHKWTASNEAFQKSLDLTNKHMKQALTSKIGLAWTYMHLRKRAKTKAVLDELTKSTFMENYNLIALAAIYALFKNSAKSLDYLKQTDDEKSVAIIISNLNEFRPIWNKILHELDRPEFHQNEDVFRLNLRPIKFWLPKFTFFSIVFFVTVYAVQQELSLIERVPYALLFLVSFLQIYITYLKSWKRKSSYRLCFSENYIKVQHYRLHRYISKNKITQVIEEQGRKRKLTVYYNSKDEEYWFPVHENLSGYEKARNLFDQIVEINISKPNFWSKVYLFFYVTTLLGLISPNVLWGFGFIFISIIGIVLGLVTLPKIKRKRKHQLKHSLIILAMTLVECGYFYYLLSS